MSEWIRVFAPASVANVGPGFDVLGFAVSRPGDIVEVRKRRTPGVVITDIRYIRKQDIGKLPQNPKKNTAGVAARNVLTTLQERGVVDDQSGVEIKLRKSMPLGSGLGSSGASAVGAAWAVNLLFGGTMAKHDPDLILACVKAEATLSGFHADNVAPSMLGGFVLIRSYEPLDIIPLDAPENMVSVVVNPEYKVSTRMARAALPSHAPLKEVVVPHYANVAGLIAGILKKDLLLLGRSIDDKIVEPVRAPLIPGFYDVKDAALSHGAFGCSISGSGPSVFAITDSLERGEVIGRAMAKAFEKHSLQSKTYVSHVNREGAKRVD
ncbi:homoserine kinase [Candidatus Moduliflexus flocculans]|uniref:Homoserine kinase n=1 Tax=Candidatus Moduliflexus flocculans TaxID=1499966 RepID=A0A0S6VSM0_9BACT|nr:homoserine kinase [Candidatus Moduliflexus flocculans]